MDMQIQQHAHRRKHTPKPQRKPHQAMHTCTPYNNTHPSLTRPPAPPPTPLPLPLRHPLDQEQINLEGFDQWRVRDRR